MALLCHFFVAFYMVMCYNYLITTKEVFLWLSSNNSIKDLVLPMFMTLNLTMTKKKKCSRAKRTLIGKIDPDTGEMIPTDGRNKGAKSKPSSSSPEIDKDKRIQELEDENRQLKLQISALKKEIERIQNSN